MKKTLILLLTLLLLLSSCNQAPMVPNDSESDSNTDTTTQEEETTTATPDPQDRFDYIVPDYDYDYTLLKGDVNEYVKQIIPHQTTYTDIVSLLGVKGVIVESNNPTMEWYFQGGVTLNITFIRSIKSSNRYIVYDYSILYDGKPASLYFSNTEDMMNFVKVATGERQNYYVNDNHPLSVYFPYDIVNPIAKELAAIKIPIPKTTATDFELKAVVVPTSSIILRIDYKIGNIMYQFNYSYYGLDTESRVEGANLKYNDIPVGNHLIDFYSLPYDSLKGECKIGDLILTVDVNSNELSETAFDVFDFVSFPTADQ